jgi:hypothetical protein
MRQRIADYISKNRHRYTREAIRQQLIDAGYKVTDIDETWAALDAPDPDDVAGEGFWGRFGLIVVGINVAVFLAVGLVTGMLQGLPQGTFVITVILGVALFIGALIAWGIVAATTPAKLGRTTALVIGITIPLVVALVVGGACYALVGVTGLPPPPPRSGTMALVIEDPAFQGEASAMCQPVTEGYEGFNVYAENLGTLDGRRVDASVATMPMPPDAALQPSVFVTLYSEAAPPSTWDSGFAPTTIELDAAPDGLSGTVTFESLPSVRGDPSMEEAEPISGTITWACE